ncbi:MAG: GNAT family N-acetyltransferase [Gammaproteobacteria bacterium]|nr:GNAT family N-acetyltransferase [Gammaproteobacteria bacterium]
MICSALSQPKHAYNITQAFSQLSPAAYTDPLFEYHGYSFVPVIEGIDRVNTFKLRASIYDEEFGWASASNNIEQDEFDFYSTHYAVKTPDGRVIATIRTIESGFNWMGDSSFFDLFTNTTKQLKNSSVNEASRLCIDRNYRNYQIVKNMSVLDFLLAGLLFYNNLRNIENTYIITFSNMYTVLKRRGMAIRKVTDKVVMPDGCVLDGFVVNNQLSLETFKPLSLVR